MILKISSMQLLSSRCSILKIIWQSNFILIIILHDLINTYIYIIDTTYIWLDMIFLLISMQYNLYVKA